MDLHFYSLPTAQQLYEAAMQGADLIIRSNLGFSVLLKDTLTLPR